MADADTLAYAAGRPLLFGGVLSLLFASGAPPEARGRECGGMKQRPCQQCGRPANYRPPKSSKQHSLKARNDHDLCRRCWARLMDALDAKAAA